VHPYTIPASVKDRVIRRQGKPASHDTIDAARTALIVVDMQNYFVAPGFPLEVPMARDIVPNINRLARALRTAGGTVIWLQTSSAAALKHWARHHNHMLTPERAKKTTYSAFMPDASEINATLRKRRIESVLITGTATNVCCESTARDAMMHDYRVVMVSDGNASFTDEEHATTLNNFLSFFGDVLTTDEVIARIVPVEARRSA